MKTIAELEEIRKKTLNEIGMRADRESTRIVVGMATCGIAAGARDVMNALVEEIQKRNLHNVNVSATGCIGVCRLEPIVEVIDKDGKRITYVEMDPQKAAKVVVEHIANGRVCTEYTIKENE